MSDSRINRLKRLWNINIQFLILTVLPTIGLGLILMLFSHRTLEGALINQAESELESVAHAVASHFDLSYPGDYYLNTTSDTSYDLLKGDTVITQKYEYLDSIKASTGIDVTLFYQDTRILTTIYNNGIRFVGTTVQPHILNDVLQCGAAHFYHNAIINSVPFFAYYEPLINSDGEVIGMLFAGKPSAQINRILHDALTPIFMIALAVCIVVGFISISFSRKFVFSIQQINTFLSDVTQGILTTNLDINVLSRHDELGDMGRNAVNMQTSLRTLIEQDVLTGLHNRRYADKRLRHFVKNTHTTSNKVVIAIGDVDFFKKVNDTYGHDAGDVVLKGVSEIMQKHMQNYGYCARWGGEEFLLVFEKGNYRDSVNSLHVLLDKIRAATFFYKNTPIQITMTFGVATCQPNDDVNILLKCADDKLYKGKTEGRNRIVT